MKHYARLCRAEFIKTRHTIFRLVHVGIPAGLILLVIAYFSFSPMKPDLKIQSFIELVAVSFPFIGSIVVALSMELDSQAGKFKDLLSGGYGRSVAFLSKLSNLLIYGFLALLLTVMGFYAGFHFVLRQDTAGFSFYMVAVILLFGGQMIEYIFHSVLFLYYGQGATIAVGITESLICALMLTGLGEGKWILFPSSWSARLCDYYMLYYWKKDSFFMYTGREILMIGVVTILVLLLALWLFQKYEGTRQKD